ncbi:MAG: hypothetical protein A2Y38_19075 [Spirochaetes bacterium GWB1_59_5]|nr:MAG: hypothetical protein A2Y38_19075 [Spirochaetes bacterium GWB1_59_5]
MTTATQMHPQGVGRDSKAAEAARITLPGAWYDLTARIGEAQAVASCALEALPGGLQGFEYVRMNHVSNLIAVMQDLLMLMDKDAELIAAQMKL